VEGDYGDLSTTPATQPGAKAGPHYNHDVGAEGKTGTDSEISPNTEVWFDLVPDQEGVAVDETTVNFRPVDPDGVMSVVIHDGPTNPTSGAAGKFRQACFPVSVPQWVPEPTE
jgi:hypothetical protein